MRARSVFVTGGSGYMGTHLLPVLLARGHQVRTLVRAASRTASERKIPPACDIVQGDVLDARTWQQHVTPGDTFVHLVGVAHPNPAKAHEFEAVDLRSAIEAIRAAKQAEVAHFIYVSVAHPSPVMKAYVDVRVRCEQELLASGIPATILRPFYVLGPGHYWPYVLKPLYWIAEALGSAGARRLGLVTIQQMTAALLHAVEDPPAVSEILDVQKIRTLRLPSSYRRSAAA